MQVVNDLPRDNLPRDKPAKGQVPKLPRDRFLAYNKKRLAFTAGLSSRLPRDMFLTHFS